MTKSSTKPTSAFSKHTVRQVLPYLDMAEVVQKGDLRTLKVAGMMGVDFNAPYTAKLADGKTQSTLLIILAMELGNKDVFDFLLTSQRINMGMVLLPQKNQPASPVSRPCAPLDAAYELKQANAAHGAYFYTQLIANGARHTAGRFKDEIAKDLPARKPAAIKPAHKLIGTALGRS